MSVSIVKVCVCLTLIAALTTETKGLFMLRPARSHNAGIESRNPSDQIGKYTKKYSPYTAPRGRKRTMELNRMGYQSYLPEEEKRALFLRSGRSTAATESESDGATLMYVFGLNDDEIKFLNRYADMMQKLKQIKSELGRNGAKEFDEADGQGFFVFPRLGRAMSFAFPRLGRANPIHVENCCNGYCVNPARCCDGFIQDKTYSDEFPFIVCYSSVNGVPGEIMGN